MYQRGTDALSLNQETDLQRGRNSLLTHAEDSLFIDAGSAGNSAASSNHGLASAEGFTPSGPCLIAYVRLRRVPISAAKPANLIADGKFQSDSVLSFVRKVSLDIGTPERAFAATPLYFEL